MTADQAGAGADASSSPHHLRLDPEHNRVSGISSPRSSASAYNLPAERKGAGQRGSRQMIGGVFDGFKDWWWTAFGGVDPAGADLEDEEKRLRQGSASLLLRPTSTMAYSERDSEGAEGTQKPLRLTQTFSKTGQTAHEDEESRQPEDPADPRLVSQKAGTAGLFASIFNLCNVCMGAGCLAMPFAFREVGMVLGLMLLVLVWALMSYSATLLCDVARTTPSPSTVTYGGLARLVFGHRGTAIAQVIIIVSCAGISTSYFQLMGDLVAPPIAYWAGDTPDTYCNYWYSKHGVMVFALVFEAMLCALPTLYALRYVSLLAVVCMYYTTFILVFRSGQSWNQGPVGEDEFITFKFSAKIFRTLSILTFSFAPHIQVVQMFSEMKDRSQANVRKWIWIAHSISLVAFALIGAFGYYMFYGKTNGNILLNHEADDTAVTIGRLGVALSVGFGYPTQAGPAVASLDGLFFPNREPSVWGRRLAWLLVFLGVTFGLAMVIDDVSIAMGLTGAGGLTCACFLLPSYIYIRTFEDGAGGKFKLWSQRIAWLTICLGVFFGSSALVVNMIDAFDGADTIDCTWPENCPAQRCCPANHTYGPPGPCP